MSILPNSGVTVSAVRGALGDGTNDIGSLCRSSRIKQWSFYKPVDSPKLNMSQPQDWYAVNDGFAINVYRDPFDLLDDFIGGIDNCWDYEKPMGTSSSPYRLGDFRGYNSTAEIWFKFAFDNQDTAYVNQTRRLVNNSTNPAVGMDEIINNFPAFSLVSSANSSQGSNWFVFFMIAADSNGNLPQSFYGCELYSICNLLDYDERFNFKVPAGITSGKYFFIPAVVRDYNTYVGNYEHLKREDLPSYLALKWWYPLPTNIFSLTVNSTPYTPTLNFTTEISLFNVAFDYYNNDEISNLEGEIMFTISEGQGYNVQISNIQINYQSATTTVQMVINSAIIPPPDTDTGKLHFNHKDSFIALKDSWKEENEMPFTVTYTVKMNGISQTYTESVKATVTEINGNPV